MKVRLTSRSNFQAAFVYLMVMHFASKPDGLPIGYMTRPTEFAELISLLDPLLWRTGPSPFASDPRDKRVGRRAWLLIVLSVVLCLLCNLMGPATAVLAIPSLDWINTPRVGNLRFLESNAAEPPALGSWYTSQAAFTCEPDQFLSRDYSCAVDSIGSSMDAWLESYLSSHGTMGFTTAWDLTFNVNGTSRRQTGKSKEEGIKKDYVYWVPSRQMLWNLTNDLLATKNLAQGYTISQLREDDAIQSSDFESYVEYNRSVQLQIQRKGPVTGFIANWAYFHEKSDVKPLPWTINVDDNRQVRCYFGIYCTEDDVCFTKCIQKGSGWGGLNKRANFFVPKAYDSEQEVSKQTQIKALGVQVDIYASDHVGWLKINEFPPWLPQHCLNAGDVTRPNTCNWDRLFSPRSVPSQVADRAQNLNTVEMYISNGDGHEVMLVHDFVAFNDFATYEIDPSPLSNPSGLVHLNNLPLDPITRSENIHVDPNWVLAGWSVANGQSIGLGRTSGTTLLRTMKSFYNNGYDATVNLANDWNYLNLPSLIGFVPIAQSLSLIDHKTQLITSSTQPDSEHPQLYRTAHMYVWGYFMASRTAILGVVVTSAGCIVVLAQLYLGFKDRRRYRSPTQLLVAAMEHMPQGEFEGKRHDEKAMARVPFHVSECDKKVIRFSSLSGQGGISPSLNNHSRVFSGPPTRHSRVSSGATLFSPTQNVFSPGRKVTSPPGGGYSPNDGYFPIAPDSHGPVAADFPPPTPIPPAGFTPVTNFSFPGTTGVSGATPAAARPVSGGAASASGSISRVTVAGRSPSLSSGSTRTHAGRSPSASSGSAPPVPPIPGGFTSWQGGGEGFQVHPTYTRTFI